jgi:hypothetical protein
MAEQVEKLKTIIRMRDEDVLNLPTKDSPKKQPKI